MPKPKKPTDPPDDDDVLDDDDVEFTPAQLRVMNNTVSAAVSAQLNRKLKPISDQLGEVSSLRESIEGIAKSLQGGKPKEGEGDGKGAAASVKDDPEIIAMRKRVEGMERAAAEKETAARNRDRDSRLTTIATTAGVDKNRVRGVVALLRDTVTFDKNGDPKMKVIRDGFDEEVDLEAGAGEFFKSDEGKAYLAPQQAVRGGSGQRTTTAQVAARSSSGTSNVAAQQRGGAKQEAKQNATAALADAVGELIGGGNISLG